MLKMPDKTATNGRVDLATVAFGALLGLGVYQIVRGQMLASASSLLVSAIAFLPMEKFQIR